MIDHAALGRLQRELLTESLESAPLEVTRYVVRAGSDGDSMVVKVESPTAFVLSDAAVAALRGIFALHASAGDPLRAVWAEIKENDDSTWSLAMEFEYV